MLAVKAMVEEREFRARLEASRGGNTHNIRAVIRGSGVNQDGKMPGGITVANSKAQEDLIASTYAKAGLSSGEDLWEVRTY